LEVRGEIEHDISEVCSLARPQYKCWSESERKCTTSHKMNTVYKHPLLDLFSVSLIRYIKPNKVAVSSHIHMNALVLLNSVQFNFEEGASVVHEIK